MKRCQMKSFMWALLLVFFCAGYGYAGFKTDNKPVLNHEKGRIFTGGKPNSHLPLPPHGEKAAGKHKKYKEDELLVKFKAGISENSKKNLHKKYGSEKIKGFPSLRIEHVKLKKGMSVDEAVKLYKADSGVEYAEPNYLFTAQNVPGDPRFNELWGLYNTGQTGGTSGADIKAPGAWNLSTGSSSVVVAVIDTGIDYGHEDLRANVWINQGELNGQAGVDDDGNGYVDDVYGWNVVSNNGNPFDDMGHGTHVAGIIGAAGNNGTGVAGVNWNVKIMACKFLDAGGYGYTDGAVACLQYIKAMKESGVNIVATNNSWGGGGYSQALYDAINAQRDILFIAAAGNNYSDNDKYPTYPANYDLPNVIAVAATDSNDGKAYFSDYGRRTVSVGAPGLGILSTLPAKNVWGITEGYGLLSGTSMATPHVTGLAALINSQDDSRDWRQTRNLILSGGEATASMTGTTITGKRISAYGALACTDSPVFSIVKYPASITAGVPVVLSALSINCSSPAGPVTMTTAGGQVIELHDDGIAPDIAAGDGIFAGTWTPSRQAERLTFSSPAGTETITVPPLVVSTYLLEGNIQAPYSHVLGARGGLAPYNWAITAGTLPPGLAFNSATGEIHGNPTVTGTFDFTVQVGDSLGSIVTKALSLRVVDYHVAELWGRAYDAGGYDDGHGVATDTAGNVYVVGMTFNGSNYDAIITKYDTSGGVIWSRTYDTGKDESAAGVIVDGSGNVYVTGGVFWNDFGSCNYLTLKYDSSGNLLWAKTHRGDYDDDRATSVALDASGNVYVTGYSFHYTDWYRYDTVTIKYDSSGNELWTKNYGNGDSGYANSIAVDAAGNVYLAGQTLKWFLWDGPHSVTDTWDFFTVKYDTDGNQLWERTFDKSLHDENCALALDGGGNVYVTGSTIDFVAYTYNSITLKYDTAGNLLWEKTYPNGGWGYRKGIAIDGSGSIYVAGTSYAASNEDYITIKYDPSGNVLWTKGSDGSTYDEAAGIAADGAGNVYVTGYTYSGENSDILTVKYRQVSDPLRITTAALSYGSVGSSYTETLTGAGGAGGVRWSYFGGLPPGLTLNEATGAISGAPTAAGTFSFTVQAMDNNSATVSKALSISVFEPLAITTSTLSAASTVNAYSQTLSATGGAPPYVFPYMWSISSGSLPPGLEIYSESGVIGGTATTEGTFTFTVQVSAANFATATKTFSITVSSLAIITPSLPPATVGVPYSQPLTAAGGSPPYTWSSPPYALPPGLALDPVAGIISGTPTMPGNFTFPIQVMDSASATVSQTFTLKVSDRGPISGTVWGWGANWNGQLGDGTNTDRPLPVPLTGLGSVQAIAGAMEYSIALKPDGTVWTWGDNYDGGLGDGTYISKNVPVQAIGLDNVKAIAAGWFHSLALKNDGTVWRWGNYSNGIGPSPPSPDLAGLDSNMPVQVFGLGSVLAVVGGGHHSVALAADGSVWTWGGNGSGQLGNGTTVNSAIPVQVPGLYGVVAVAAGVEHSMALKADGTVWAWGKNGDGQLGDGTNIDRSTPVPVQGLYGVTAIFGGGWHSIALKADGTVWTWGNNNLGQLGNRTNIGSNTPVQVVDQNGIPFNGVMAIDGECFSTIALKSDGTVWEWGGYFSSGVNKMSNIPVRVDGIGGVAAIAAGMDHRIALVAGPPPPDTTPPVTTAALSGTPGHDGWYLAPVQVTLTATDNPGGSGVAAIEYSFDETSWIQYAAPFMLTAEGTTTIYYRSADNAGNLEQPDKSLTVKVTSDVTPPTTQAALSGTAGQNGWYVSDVQATLTATDNPGGSGVARTEYSFDATNWTQYSAPVAISANGTTTLYFRSVDNVGNWEEPYRQLSVSIDKTAPRVDVTLSGTRTQNGWFSSDVQVTIAAGDAPGESGVATVEYSFDNTVWSAYTAPIIITTDGATPLYYRATDNAGKSVSALYNLILIDKSGGAKWTPLGPNGGIIQAVAFSPAFAEDHTAFAGGRLGGAFKTTDGGISWTAANGGIVMKYISALAVSTTFASDRTAFAGSYGNVYKTTDGGASWVPLGNGTLFGGNRVVSLAVSPNYSADFTLFAGTNDHGVYRSVDGGATWASVYYPGYIQSMAVSPAFATDRTVFAAKYGGVIKSVDGGVTWVDAQAGLVTDYVNSLAISPAYASDLTIFAATNSYGVYKTIDGGVSWANVATGTARGVVVSPAFATDRTVFAGKAGGVLKSTDGGLTWVTNDSGITAGGFDNLAISPNYASDHMVLAGSLSGGMFRTSDGAVSWIDAGRGITNVDALTVAPSPVFTTDRIAFVATSVGLFKTSDGGSSWEKMTNGLPSSAVSVAVSPYYTADQTVFAAVKSYGIYKSVNAGASWTRCLSSSDDIKSIAVSPNYLTDQTLFVSTLTNGYTTNYCLLRSTDGGTTWVEKYSGTGSNNYYVAVSPNYASDGTLFFGSYGRGYKSSNKGDTWGAGPAFMAVAFSPAYATDRTLFVGRYGGVSKSTDGGTTWTQVNAGLPQSSPGIVAPIYSLAVSPDYPNDQRLFAGTYGYGVYTSVDGGASWTPFNSGINNFTSIYALAFSPGFAVDKMVFAGTKAGGVWSYNLGRPPVSGIISPLNGTVVSSEGVTITGIAADSGSGSGIRQVEVSTDGGLSWNTASGTALWSYAWRSPASGYYTILSRATDNAGKVEVPLAGVTVIASGAMTESFESGVLNSPWATGGNGQWSVDRLKPNVGAYSAEAPFSINDNQSSYLEITRNCAAGTISYWYSVSSELWYDYLRFYVDGVEQGTGQSGEVPWTRASFPVSAGTHTFRWVYSKDVSVSDGYDTAWIDDISFPGDGSDTTPPDTAIVSSPTDPYSSGSGLFSFLSSEPAATFRCSLDGGPFAICQSPFSFAGLIDGSHTFSAASRDMAGNTDPTPAVYSWTIDTSNVLTVNRVYSGKGAVTSSPSGLYVPIAATSGGASFNRGTQVTLAAVADPKSVFAGWSGACSGTGPCTVTMDGPKAVTAKFILSTMKASPPDTLTVPATSTTGNFMVSWTISSTGATTYVLEESNDPNFGTSTQVYSGPDLSASLTGRGYGTYYYRVKAVADGYLDSDWRTGSNGCMVAQQCAAPASATLPATSATGNFTVTWEASSTLGSTYVLEESADAGFGAVRQVYSGPDTSAPLSGKVNGTYYYRVKAVKSGYFDSLWSMASNAIVVDTTAPTSSITTPLTNAILTGAGYTITGTAGDDTGSGVQRVEVSTDGGATWSPAVGTTNWSYNWNLPGDGPHTIRSRATDAAGNVEVQPQGVTVVVDNTPPAAAITKPASNEIVTGAGYTITGTATDGAGSGVQRVEISTDGGATWTPAVGTTSWSYNWALSTDGNYTLVSRAIDGAGHVGASSPSVHAIVDNTPPTALVTTPAVGSFVAGAACTITGTAGDGIGSGVQKVEVSTDGGATWNQAGGTANWSYSWSLPSDGSYAILCRVTDNAGHVGTSPLVTATVDNTPPVTTIDTSGTAGLNDWFISDVQVTLSASDSGSGVQNTQYSLDGTTWNLYTTPFTISSEGETLVSFRSVDKAGIVEATGTRRIKIDKKGPVYDERVSVSTSGGQANGMNSDQIISDDGRYVLFASHATNLVSGSTGQFVEDVLLRDRQAGTTERISALGSGQSYNRPGGITPDGRFVTFYSFYAVKLLDRQSGSVELISVSSSGAPATFGSTNYGGSISADGRYVAFTSDAGNLAAGDSGWYKDVFVRDRQTGVTERVSVSSSGAGGNADSYGAFISADGRYVYFTSDASNLVAGDTNGVADVFVRDRQTGTTARVSVSSAGVQSNGKSTVTSTSSDGRYVVFQSDASNLVAGDTNGAGDIFLHDLQTGGTRIISVSSTGQLGAYSSDSATISPDGRYVGFMSKANLVAYNPLYFPYFSYDSYIHDCQTGTTELLYVRSSDAYAKYPAFSRDGKFTVFQSNDDTLVSGDSNGSSIPDIFVRDNSAVTLSGTLGGNGWYTSDVQVTLLPAKDPVSGIARMEYSTDGTTWIAYIEPFAVSTQGTTTLFSRSVDNAGNIGKATSTFIKTDQSLPVTTVQVDGSLGGDGWYSGNIVVMLSGSDGGGSGVARTEYSFNGTDWITYGAPFTISTEGTTSFSYRSVDVAGQAEFPQSVSVQIDKTAPSLSVTSPASGSWVTGTTVTINGTATDGTGSGVKKVEISTDGGTTWSPTVGTGSWSFAWTLPADGTYTIKSRATDNAGNVGFAEVSLTVDKTPPTVVITSPAAGLTNNRTPQLTYAVSDGTVVVKVGGVVVDKVSGDSLAPLADVTHTVRVEATDTAGNSAFAEVTFGVDTAAPAGGMVINSGAAFTTTPAVTLTLTASDTNGVVEMQFSNDGSSWSSPEPFAITKAWALSSGDGSKSVYVRYRDAAGNWTTAAITAVIVLDTAAPSGAVDINGGSAYTTTTAVTLTLSAADTNGVTQMQFSNNGSSWSSPEPFATTKAWALSSGDGSKSVYGKYKDAAGNWTTANIYGTIMLDTTAPAGSIVINGGSSYTASAAVTLTLSATDASGVTGMQFSNDGSTWTTPEAYATTRNWTLTTADGNKTVYVRYKDANGIWSSPTAISSTIVLDTTAPTITSIDPFNNSTGVPLNKVISSLFTDNVQAGTSYGSIALKKANSAVSITVTVNGSVLNITPISDLSRNTKYTVTIPAGAVMDMAGNALTTASTISFTTTK